MEFWANKMPAGMLLRSPRAASSIADPRRAFTLEAYESASGVSPKSRVALETFVDYGRWFQNQSGLALERTLVRQVDRVNGHFRVALENGDVLTSRRVVVAAGVGPFAKKPSIFAELEPSQVSHCYEGRKLGEFTQKRVAVIGAGQSALESAALLQEAGAEVEVIARIPRLRWIGVHKWLHRMGPLSALLYSKYDVGPIGISRLVAAPGVVRHIPLRLRDKIRTRAVRSAGAPWLGPRLGSVRISVGRHVQSAKSLVREVQLILDDGSERRVDHVLLGTGYRVEISQYRFLAPTMVSEIIQFEGYPKLEGGFRSSVPGLHFIGAPAARSFGPLLYFVAGTDFTSQALTDHICRNRVNVSA
jgi:hypothetical protein